MVASEKTMTVAEFEQFAEAHDDRRFELIHGEVVEKVPTQLHAYIVALLTTALMNFLHEHPIGRALVEARYSLPGDEHNNRIPDLSFITNEKGALVKQGAAPYMPDLAIEVQSPSQSEKLLADKADYYLTNGTRMVWLIYPDKGIVEVLTPDDRHLLIASDTLDGSDVLPGFTMPIAPLFAE